MEDHTPVKETSHGLYDGTVDSMLEGFMDNMYGEKLDKKVGLFQFIGNGLFNEHLEE